jgi:class 3 adenylate cyclase
MRACAACGQENRSGARFCDSCGAPLATTVAPAREERKVVTVLFADLVGFTSRAEQMDPEDVRALLVPYHQRLRAELERFGGTVEKFIGDAAMALFGAPVAHEDDPERAVRSALAIRDWVLEEGGLQVRLAVNTGEALIALGADPAAGEGMASGDVVNSTMRLQSAAPTNGILVGETTYRATRPIIDYRAADAVVAKGKDNPIPAWEAIASAAVSSRRSRGSAVEGSEPRSPIVFARSASSRSSETRSPATACIIGVDQASMPGHFPPLPPAILAFSANAARVKMWATVGDRPLRRPARSGRISCLGQPAGRGDVTSLRRRSCRRLSPPFPLAARGNSTPTCRLAAARPGTATSLPTQPNRLDDPHAQ